MSENTRGHRGLQSSLEACKTASSSQRQAILVLGMHRSGTSAISGAISALGVAGPKTLASPNEWNPRGYFESPRIFAAHDELLASISSCRDDWRQLDPRTLLSKAGQYREVIKKLLIDEFGCEPLIFIKDPRICRFVPFVCSILAELNFSPFAVLVARNPLKVAHSLKRREKFALSKPVLLWLRHVLDAEFHSRHMPRCFLSYEDVLVDWRRQMDLVAKKIGIRWPDCPDRSDIKIDEFLSADLRHERFSFGKIDEHSEVVPLARDTHETLMNIVASGETRELLDRLDQLRTKFNDACRTFELAVADMQAAQYGLAAERDEVVAARDMLSSECVDLRSERDDLISARDRLSSECAALRWERDNLVASRDSLLATTDELGRERDGLKAERDGLARERDGLKAKRDALADDNERLLVAYDAVLVSTSWRVTAPLRSFKKLFSRSSRLFGRAGRASGR
jgi:hypothetical protein